MKCRDQTLKGTDLHGARLRRDWRAVYVSTSPSIMSIMDSAKTGQLVFIISITESGEASALCVRSMAKSRETVVAAALKEGKHYNQDPVITHRHHEILILVRGLCQSIAHSVENGQVSIHGQKGTLPVKNLERTDCGSLLCVNGLRNCLQRISMRG
jgi:hypothetical protein